MINIVKNTVNADIVVSVTENVTLVSPYFLFEFKSLETNNFYYCIATNVSTETARYDEFSIEDKVSPNPLVGEVDLPVGTYSYKIYEQTSSTNLDPLLTTSEVDVNAGRVTEVSVSPIVTYESADTNNVSYNP